MVEDNSDKILYLLKWANETFPDGSGSGLQVFWGLRKSQPSANAISLLRQYVKMTKTNSLLLRPVLGIIYSKYLDENEINPFEFWKSLRHCLEK